MAKISLERLLTLDKNFLLTSEEVGAVVELSAATISKHRHAGLLPFVPGRPVRHRVADVLVYRKMLLNGVKDRLHRSMHIDYYDRAIYSPLHGVTSYTEMNYKNTIEAVVSETDKLFRKYKAQREAEKLNTKTKST